MRTPHGPHRRRAAVLFVVGVEDEEHFERAREHGIRLVLHLGHLEHHVQEVAGEAEVVVRVDVGPADAVTVRIGGDARHLRDQAMGLPHPRVFVEDVLGVGIERRERADRAEEDAHRVGVVLKALHELLDVLVEHRVVRDLPRPVLELRGGGQFTEENQVGRLEVVAFLGQLLDWIPAIEQDALVAVDIRDGAAAVRRVQKRRVVRHQAEVVWRDLDFPEIHRPDGAVGDGDFVRLPGAVVGDCDRVGHW